MKKLIWILPVVIAGILSTGIMYNISSREKSDYRETIIENLEYIENIYIQKLDFKERRVAIRKVDEIYSLLGKMDSASSNYSSVMPDSAFSLLLKSMKDEKWDKDRLETYSRFSQRYFFTASQFHSLAETITFTSAKTAFIKDNISRISTKEELITFMTLVDSNLLDDIFDSDHSTHSNYNRK